MPPFRPDPPLVIGLLGGVAAGKSAAAAHLARRGLVVVDADRKARAVLDDAGVRAAIAQRFGDAALDAAGAVDRPALARTVFADAAARRDLEAIVHPPVRAALEQALGDALARGDSVVLDIPLLLENGWHDRCDCILFLDTPLGMRQSHARARGWDDGELARREAHQTPIEEKRRRATAVVANDGDLAQLGRRLDAALLACTAPRRRRPGS